MPTPADAPYKARQHAAHYATFHDRRLTRTLTGGVHLIRTRSGREYVVDPTTGVWWRPEKYAARYPNRRA